MMRKLITIISTVLLTASLFAQSPQKMSYQAVIRDDYGELVQSHAVGMQISILKDENPVFVETHSAGTNENGLVTIEIGGGTFVSGVVFSAIDWSDGTYFIKTETDPTGGTNYAAIVGTSQILSVPYALHSKTVASYDETDPNAVLLTGNQTITGNKTFSGTTTVNTPVNANDAANKAYVDNMLSIIQTIQTGVRDVDGNIYKVILIGNQLWMEENLKTTKYNDGTEIPNTTVDETWAALTTGAYCDFSNTPANSTTYGRLYNWYAVDNNAATKDASNGGKNVCPTGWHVSTDAEWTTLTTYLGGESIAGGKLKETDTDHWIAPNTGATNESGFTALPGGGRNNFGIFFQKGNFGYWWSSTENSTSTANYREMNRFNSNVFSYNYYKVSGYSVRCLRD